MEAKDIFVPFVQKDGKMKEQSLMRMIAQSLDIKEDEVTYDFSLNVSKFKSSAGSVILNNIVNKIYGKKVDLENISTVGELIARIENADISGDRKTTDVDNPDDNSDYEENFTNKKEENYDNASFPGFQQRANVSLVCGIDIQEIDIFPEVNDYWEETFYTDNFTSDEIAYCVTTVSPRHSFAARWCLKEALHKSGDKFFALPLKDIQVVKLSSGRIQIEVRNKKDQWDLLPFACSISHADHYAVGMVTGISEE